VAPTETEAGGPNGLLRVEVIIRHREFPLVRRLAQIIRVPEDTGLRPISNPATPAF